MNVNHPFGRLHWWYTATLSCISEYYTLKHTKLYIKLKVNTNINKHNGLMIYSVGTLPVSMYHSRALTRTQKALVLATVVTCV